MGKVLVVAATNNGTAVANANELPFVGGIRTAAGAGATQFRAPVSGTISLLGANINATGGTRSISTVIGGSAGNQTASIADAASGWFEDASNSDSLSAGNLFEATTAEAGTNPTYFATRVVFEATSGHVSLLGGRAPNAAVTGTNYWIPGGEAVTGDTTQANRVVRCRSAGTLGNAFVFVRINTGSGTATFKSTIGTGLGNISISIGAGLTGIFTDTSNTDTLSDGTDWGFEFVKLSGTTMTVELFGCSVTQSGATNDIFCDNNDPRSASATTHFYPIMGDVSLDNLTTESQAVIQHGFAGTASKLRAFISANTYSGTSTIALRKDAGAGNQTISVGAGVTGNVEDSSNTDTFTATSDICISVVGGTANSMTIQWFGLTEEPTAAAAVYPIDPVITMFNYSRPELIGY